MSSMVEQLMGDVSFCMRLKMPLTAGIALSGIFVHSCKSFSEYSRTFVVGKETRLFYLIYQVPETGLIMSCHLIILLVCSMLVCGQGETKNHRAKRSPDSLTFQELKSIKPERFNIANADCSFKKQKDGCPVNYKARGTCNFDVVSSQLFPDVNLEESTNRFIVPAKFEVKKLEIFDCQGNQQNGMVRFVANSVESVELAMQLLTLGAQTRMKLSWNTLAVFNPEKLEVNMKGPTSIGSDTQVELRVEKSMEDSDYVIKFNLGSLNVNNFLAKFGVDASQMISSDLRFASSRMGLETLIMQEPKVDGLFSPGGGFEIIATGKITAPELPADASKFYVIVQDFKEGASNSANEGYGKPIAAVFAIYKNERVEDLINSLTRFTVPMIAAFKDVNEVAITAATKGIFNINSKVLRNIAEKFVPVEGMDIISKGLTIMHYTPNSNEDIKDINQKTAERILFRVEVKKAGLTWTSPQRIETQMVKMANFVWSLRGCKEKLAIPFETKGVFVDIAFLKKKGQMEVSFNLTERVPVLENGLVSLFNSTITLFSKEKKDGCSWKLRGEGRESILDELVDITIIQKKKRTNVLAIANIFDMQTLMNRTQAKPFNERYEAAFEFLTRVPFQRLRYEASFEWKRVLKFKGFALFDGKPPVEVLYFIANGMPLLKLGFEFKNQYLHKVVRLFYGEDKIKSTWIKFNKICISIKNIEPRKTFKFDRGCIRKADATFSTAGIGFIGEKLKAKDCDRKKWKMCSFLKTYLGGVVDMTYYGQMLPGRVTMITRDKLRFDLGKELIFYKDQVISKIDSANGGDRLSFEANVLLTRTTSMFAGKIYDDGTNKIMLHFASEAGSMAGRNLLQLPYARMDPVRSKFAIPAEEHVKVIEFQSRLHIGSVEESQLEFSGHSARQYLSYDNDETMVKFVGEKIKLKLSNLFNAFDISDRNKFLRKAMFPGQVVVAYASTEEGWNLTDFGINVKKGLHFYGKLKLNTEETYETTINLRDNNQLQTIVHLDPLRYGKMANSSKGKSTFQHINLFLHRNSERSELGPNLICEGQLQTLTGYAETVGLVGSFTSDKQRIGPKNFQYQIKLKGNLYNEVENAEVTLTTTAEDRPKDFKFKYEADITSQSRSRVNNNLREVLEDIKKNAEKGRAAAKEKANDVKDLLNSYKQKHQGHLSEMRSVVDQIHNINNNVDLALIDISTDCIDQCKTVMMPGIEWKQECLAGSGGQRNMKCMTWRENKDKVINVMCVLKCEAKKMTAAGEAAASLQDIRRLVNRYREQKVLSQDAGKFIELVEQADEIAKSAKELVERKSHIQDNVKKLLTLSGDLIELNTLRVDTNLESISPPCIPFQLDFTIKTQEPTTHNGVYPICFNGEFYKNVGLRIMRMKYPAIDEMYKALEEAELRYARIGGIKKSLTRVENDIEKASKRSNIPSSIDDDPVERVLTKMAKRRIPTFTLKSDKTVLAFHHYSPWATIKRTDPLEMMSNPSHSMKYNTSSFKEKSACQQTKDVIAEYKDISDNLEQLSSNYKHGKLIYGKTENSIKQDLDSSHEELNGLINKTKLFPSEKRDMLYWYQFTKQGMNKYLQTFSDHLTKQNKRSLSYLKDDLSLFYGTDEFVGHLRDHGSDAVSRSTVTRPKKDKQITDITEIGSDLHKALSMSLEEAETVNTKLRDDIQTLLRSTASC